MMNTPLNLTRTCARQCCKPRPQPSARTWQIERPSSTRFLSTTSSRSANHSNVPVKADASLQSEAFSHTQPEVNQQPPTSKFMQSTLPQDQSKRPPAYLWTGTVTRTGSMPKTVQITRHHQVYDKFLKKHYTRPLRLKAHDPNPLGYLREGDVVEYGTFTQAEKNAKKEKDDERIRLEEKRLEESDKSGKAVRRFKRVEETKRKLKGNKERGVQFVVRRVVTPFATGLDERMEKLGLEGEVMNQHWRAAGGRDSLLNGLGGNSSRQSGSAAVAG